MGEISNPMLTTSMDTKTKNVTFILRDIPKEPATPPCPYHCGKCCQHIMFTAAMPWYDEDQFKDAMRWLGVHVGVSVDVQGGRGNMFTVRMDAPCGEQTEDGLCKIHDHKPDMCRAYKCPRFQLYLETGKLDTDENGIIKDGDGNHGDNH